MIPILYGPSETAFTSNGICRLPDCGMCLVTEERNGVYECQFTYPVNGHHYADIKEGRIIFVTHDETGRGQPFDIYAHTEPIDGVVTFFAHHVSYRLGRVILSPFTATNCTEAFANIPSHTYNSISPFTFWTSKSNGGNFKITVPKPVKEALGGSQGSILDLFNGGEYEWDRFLVRLFQNRGVNTGVTIRYGVNMTGYDRDLDYLNAYGAVVPYWASTEGGVMVTPGVVYADGYNASNTSPVVMDLSAEFDTQPTEAQLTARARQKMASNQTWLPKDNITVSFAQLWQTEEYASFAPLQRLRLCDRVNVVYGPGNVTINGVEIIRTVWDVLLERYDSMELGSARTSFEQMLTADISEAILGEVPTKSFLEEAIAAATEMLVRGGYGSYVVFNTDDAGNPNEILIMDNPDVSQAVNIWRWNRNGLGFSSNGYNGPYSTAITADGKINASMITTGTLNAAYIKGGTLTLGGSTTNWRGALQILDENEDQIGTWTKDGITVTKGWISLGGGNFTVTSDGIMTCTGARINGGRIETTDANNTTTLVIDNGCISGYQGQTIQYNGGLDFTNNITIDTYEIDLTSLNALYVYNPYDRKVSKGITKEITIYGQNQTHVLKFVNGIVVGHSAA